VVPGERRRDRDGVGRPRPAGGRQRTPPRLRRARLRPAESRCRRRVPARALPPGHGDATPLLFPGAARASTRADRPGVCRRSLT
jgi:hypothetical protein